MVWVWSDQRSIRSGRSDHSFYSLDPWSGFGLIRGQFGLEGLISSALFFPFYVFLLRDVGSERGNNKAAFQSETRLKSDDSDQKQGVQLIAKAGPLKRKF